MRKPPLDCSDGLPDFEAGAAEGLAEGVVKEELVIAAALAVEAADLGVAAVAAAVNFVTTLVNARFSDLSRSFSDFSICNC